MNLLKDINQNIIAGKADEVTKLISVSLAEGITAQEILDEGLLAGMTVVSARFKEGMLFIPEVLISARAMNKGFEILDPLLADGKAKYRGTLLIGTVLGDLHDIGKNLASILFRGAGFKIIDLGANVSPETFTEKTLEHKPDLIGLSALLTTTMQNMGTTIDALRANNITTPVIVGGAPLSQAFADSISADIFAASASDGIEQALTLLN